MGLWEMDIILAVIYLKMGGGVHLKNACIKPLLIAIQRGSI